MRRVTEKLKEMFSRVFRELQSQLQDINFFVRKKLELVLNFKIYTTPKFAPTVQVPGMR